MSNGHLLEHVLAFSALLREMGVDVGPGQDLELVRALEHVPITDREDFRWAARCTLIWRHEDLPVFDTAWGFYWPANQVDPLAMILPQIKVPGKPLRLPRKPQGANEGDGDDKQDDQEDQISLTLTYTAGEILRAKNFDAFSWEEVQAAKVLMRRMHWRIDERRTRRSRPAAHGKRLDMRRMLRRNMRYGGEPIEMAWRDIKSRPRPLVVLCDISGSMDRYSRILLQFVHAMSNGLRTVESFVFGTRLTRITRLLHHRDIDDAISLVSKQVVDWSGGTRIGETIKEFNFRWGRRVLGRGAVVLVISDGWDRGDPHLLAHEMSRLQRSCHRLIWLNPLLGTPGYQPLTQGMQAALPYVDDFLPVHNLISLEQLAEKLSAIGERRTERKQRLLEA